MRRASFFSGGPDWSDHWLNGGTGVTKGVDAELAESVRLFNDPTIYVKGTELHTSKVLVDLSEFWTFHRTRTAK